MQLLIFIYGLLKMWQSNSGNFDEFPEWDDLNDYFDDLEKVQDTKDKAGEQAHDLTEGENGSLVSTWDSDDEKTAQSQATSLGYQVPSVRIQKIYLRGVNLPLVYTVLCKEMIKSFA